MPPQKQLSDGRVVPSAPPGLRWRIDRGVVEVAGEVDSATADVFATALAACNHDTTVAALDLSSVSFFSAAGVRCFVSLGWTTGAHPMVIASPAVRRVLAICQVDFLLERHGWTGGSVSPTRVA